MSLCFSWYFVKIYLNRSVSYFDEQLPNILNHMFLSYVCCDSLIFYHFLLFVGPWGCGLLPRYERNVWLTSLIAISRYLYISAWFLGGWLGDWTRTVLGIKILLETKIYVVVKHLPWCNGFWVGGCEIGPRLLGIKI